MNTNVSLKNLFWVAGLAGLGSAAARSFIWLYKSREMSGLQIWAPTLISVGLVVLMLALICRLFINAADEADPLKGWLESRQLPPTHD
jgi:hypothetical protein